MMATCSQSEDSSDDENEEEVANMCFMAFKDQNEVKSNFDDDEFIIEYGELLNKLTSLMKSINGRGGGLSMAKIMAEIMAQI